MIINEENCTKCELCIDDCPLGAIFLAEDGMPRIDTEICVNARGCVASRDCPSEAFKREETLAEAVPCDRCPVRCEIMPGKIGDCKMRENHNGAIVRAATPIPYEDVKEIVGEGYDPVIRKPIITAIGAGTRHPTDPCPFIVQDKVAGVDVVTCCTESHFLFSGIKTKIDTEAYIGEEGSRIFHKDTFVGRVVQEQYGSKMLELGGINTLSAENGWRAAKIIADIANREKVNLRVEGGSELEVQVGEEPVINGKRYERRRFGCGGEVSYTLGFEMLLGLVDHVIVIDRGYTGRVGEPAVDIIEDPWAYSATTSGIKLRFETPFIFFFPHEGGDGWGCTKIQDPLDMIESFDPQKLEPGFTLLITEPSADRIAFYEFTKDRKFKKAEMPSDVKQIVEEFKARCEPARVSAYYMAGAGGTARRGITLYPEALSKAILNKKARLTVGGAPTHVYTGGGINFIVNVERVKKGAFYWTGAHATVAPIEFTMKLRDYEEIGGHVESIISKEEVLSSAEEQ
jgi:Pyruvate/2-oxoacid:ferredoxin oxidoreductase delta subunit